MTTTEIDVTAQGWDESEYDEAGRLSQAEFTTSYAGGMSGESRCRFLVAYVKGDAADPSSLEGEYTGMERVTGTLDGRTGSFVLQMQGTHGDGGARTSVRIVPGSGTGELAGITGAGRYVAGAMTYTLTLDYELA